MKDNECGLNQLQRKCGSFTLNQVVQATIFTINADMALTGITIGLDYLKKKNTSRLDLTCNEITESFKAQFGNQIFGVRQNIAMDFNGTKFDLVVDSFERADLGLTAADSSCPLTLGQVLMGTTFTWKKQAGSQSNIRFIGGVTEIVDVPSNHGIGGLGPQFQVMFRRAFASRIFPGLMKQLGINHIRGILLYGPPGCGKTLIARQIGKVLNAREPKIINGPEVLDKFVGGSEEKIRALFVDAEKEQAEMGDASMLHIIIFDEMDAVMKTRGSTRDSTGVADSIVNQLLSKIDGVDSLNNILIIGMTNRKDMIDEAILRPGRLELHIEITLPSEEGRQEILRIHTASMRKNNRISADALDHLTELAANTKNYTGAELEGLVRIAASYALSRNTDAAHIKAIDEASVRVEWGDFERALQESVPAFGNKDGEEISTHIRNGICKYGPSFDDLWATLQRLVSQTRTSSRTPLMSVLLEGPASTGKTAVAAQLCKNSDFPFIRMISADFMIGLSEAEKCSHLLKTFNDSYKSPLSIIFIDDIERLLEYTPIGPRFSNVVLQTLLVLIRRVPPVASSRLMVIATTSIADRLEDLQLTQSFQINVHVSQLQSQEEVHGVLREYSSLSAQDIRSIASTIDKPIGIKQLLLVLEMARADSAGETDTISSATFMECLHTAGF